MRGTRDGQTSRFLPEFAEQLHGFSFTEEQSGEEHKVRVHDRIMFYGETWLGLTVYPGPLHSSRVASAHPQCLAAAASSPHPALSPLPVNSRKNFRVFSEKRTHRFIQRDTLNCTWLQLTAVCSIDLHVPRNFSDTRLWQKNKQKNSTSLTNFLKTIFSYD